MSLWRRKRPESWWIYLGAFVRLWGPRAFCFARQRRAYVHSQNSRCVFKNCIIFHACMCVYTYFGATSNYRFCSNGPLNGLILRGWEWVGREKWLSALGALSSFFTWLFNISSSWCKFGWSSSIAKKTSKFSFKNSYPLPTRKVNKRMCALSSVTHLILYVSCNEV